MFFCGITGKKALSVLVYQHETAACFFSATVKHIRVDEQSTTGAMPSVKKYATSVLLCVLLLFSGLTVTTREEPPGRHRSSAVAQSDRQAPGRIYIWKDREGVMHIGDEPPKLSGKPCRVSEKSVQPQFGQTPAPEPEQTRPAEPVQPPESIKLAVQSPVQSEEQVMSRLQVQREELEVLFIRARNRGDGYAQIRLRHLLDANSKEQERLRSRISNRRPPSPQDHP